MSELFELSATEAARGIQEGRFSSVELVDACLQRISDTDSAIGAWAFLDPDLARSQAKAMDELRQHGKPTGPLHGVPVGIKDIFDTADMPTAYGSPIFEKRQPTEDSTVVSRLREAGAVILGKTVTTEFAFLAPARTQNPHRSGHSPGGSSSGSAAAVAAQQVPLAVGSQSNGSVIRPASFCGVYGLKPSYGLVSRRGVLHTSDGLDQVGVFARSVEDAALIVDQVTGFDIDDSATRAVPKPRLVSGFQEEVPVEPRFAFLNAAYDDRLSEDAREGFQELREVLGNFGDVVDLPESYVHLLGHHKVLYESDIAKALGDTLPPSLEGVSAQMRETLTRGSSYGAEAYQEALEAQKMSRLFFEDFFNDYDAIVAPCVPGEAPSTLESTGDPTFCTLWTLLGLPCLALPLMQGASGLPIGVQLIAGWEEDGRLMRTARWLEHTLRDE